MISPSRPDGLFAALNPLVGNGTLSPQQADAVFQAVHRDAATGATAADTQGWDRPRLLASVSILAAGLLAAAYSLGVSANDAGGLGWKSTLIILGSALVAAAAAAVLLVLLRDRTWSTWVGTTLAALALVGLASALMVLWDPEALVYVAGIIMLLGGAAGFWFLQGQLLSLVAVVGGGLLLGQIFDDTLSGAEEDTGNILMVGLAFLLYGLVVAAAGWLTSARHLLGVVGLSIGIVAMTSVMAANAFLLALVVTFADPDLGTDPSGSGGPSLADVRGDIRVAMIFGLVVAVIAAAAHAYSGYAGFAVVAFIGAATLLVTGVTLAQSEHPIRWASAYLVLGAVVVIASLGAQLFGNRRPAGAPGGPGKAAYNPAP